jgi:3-oxoacyl-[acyl-carrier-protein] synthase II
MTDVVVTGLGVISPIGSGKEGFWDGLMDGRSAGARITRFDPSELKTQIACEINDFDPQTYMSARDASRADRFTQFGFAASKLAWEDSGLEELPCSPERIGALIGTAMGGVETVEREQAVLLEKGPQRVNPMAAIKLMANETAGMLSIEYGLMGPTFSIASACATGAHAIGEAARMIKSGSVDVMIAGGTDSAITPLWIAAFGRMGAISTRNDAPQQASRPFDANRDGFVFGEGAGSLILERRDLAEKRGARIYAEVAGYGATTDAFHLAQPHPEGAGAELAIRLALKEAKVDPKDVDYINAHGTGTDLNDKLETLAIKNALGVEAKKVVISSTKSQMGHLMGAAGVVESIVSILAIERGRVPGTINLETPDEECDLDYAADGPRTLKVRLALNNSFGLGGANATLVFRAL